MTLCNMSVEAGASASIISPDTITQDYLRQALARRPISVSDEHVQAWLGWVSTKIIILSLPNCMIFEVNLIGEYSKIPSNIQHRACNLLTDRKDFVY